MCLILWLLAAPVSLEPVLEINLQEVRLTLGAPLLQSLKDHPPSKSEWRLCFQVFLADAVPADRKAHPPILGRYAITDRGVSFYPRFPFLPDRNHAVRLDLQMLHRIADVKFTNPPIYSILLRSPSDSRQSKTSVTAVYPSGDLLPANTLKFYIHFSHPIKRGNVYRHLRLLDQTGKEVADPFLDVEQELWDVESRRLTLFFHPGRIKQGLVPRLQQGLAMNEGSEFTLVIDKQLQDAGGLGLESGFQKTFVAGPEDRQSPNYQSWRIDPPKASSSQPLAVLFDEALDAALASRMISIYGPDKKSIAGSGILIEGELGWRFTPNEPWPEGVYTLEINPLLEDRSGNSLLKTFDAPMGSKDKNHPTCFTITFHIKTR